MDEKTKAALIAKDFMSWVNHFSHDRSEFVKIVCHDHPTLQQGAMRIFLECIKDWAGRDYYDARNEATVKLCKDIVEKCGEEGEFYLPFI